MGRAQNANFAECSECISPVQMMPVDAAAKVRGVSSRTIYRLVEAGKLHFQETPDGLPLVCVASLSAIKSENLEIQI